MKSASTWALIVAQGRYSMSNWPNSIAHESSYCVYLVHCLSYGLVCHDDDGVCLEIRTEFSGGDQ